MAYLTLVNCDLERERIILSLLGKSYWFLRHGETDWNAQYLSQGRTDVPLNATGLAQAECAGKALAARFAQGERPFTHIVSSPLKRAFVTAQKAREAILAVGGPDLPLSSDEDLQEVAFGVQEGQPMGQWYDPWIAGVYVPEGGELFVDLRARAVQAVNRALAAGQGSPLIVAHGALFRALRSAMDLPVNVRLPNATPLLARYVDRHWELELETLP